MLHGLSIVGVLALPYVIVANWARSFWGFDAYAYWSVDLADVYGRSLGNTSGLGAFRYTPPVAQLFSLFKLLPWEVYFALWFALMVAILVWLTGRSALAWVAFPPIVLELYHGNVHFLMAAAIVLGFRWPATWAFVALTKVSPAVGALWFAFRGEWRAFGTIVAVTTGIALASWLVAPDLWNAYVRTMLDNFAYRPPNGYPFDIPLAVRLGAAVAMVGWGARTGRRWTVPVAAVLSLPLIWWHGLTILVASVPFLVMREPSGLRGRLGDPGHVAARSGADVRATVPQ